MYLWKDKVRFFAALSEAKKQLQTDLLGPGVAPFVFSSFATALAVFRERKSSQRGKLAFLSMWFTLQPDLTALWDPNLPQMRNCMCLLGWVEKSKKWRIPQLSVATFSILYLYKHSTRWNQETSATTPFSRMVNLDGIGIYIIYNMHVHVDLLFPNNTSIIRKILYWRQKKGLKHSGGRFFVFEFH